MSLFSSLKSAFTKSQVYPSGPDVIRPEDIAEQKEKREKKGFFERVSETASSLISGIRDRFKSKAMRVVEMDDLQAMALEESLGEGRRVVIDRDNERVLSTRWTSDRRHPDRHGKSGSIFGSYERRVGGPARPVSSTIWSRAKKVNPVEKNPPGSLRTGTGYNVPASDPGFYTESKVSSIVALKYGVNLMKVENAYAESGRTCEQISNKLRFRSTALSKRKIDTLLSEYALSLFENGVLNNGVLGEYVEDLLSCGVSQSELTGVLCDTAEYSFILNPPVLVVAVNTDSSHNGMFDDFSQGIEELSQTSISGTSEVVGSKFIKDSSFGIIDRQNFSSNSESEIVEMSDLGDDFLFPDSNLRETMRGEEDYTEKVKIESRIGLNEIIEQGYAKYEDAIREEIVLQTNSAWLDKQREDREGAVIRESQSSIMFSSRERELSLMEDQRTKDTVSQIAEYDQDRRIRELEDRLSKQEEFNERQDRINESNYERFEKVDERLGKISEKVGDLSSDVGFLKSVTMSRMLKEAEALHEEIIDPSVNNGSGQISFPRSKNPESFHMGLEEVTEPFGATPLGDGLEDDIDIAFGKAFPLNPFHKTGTVTKIRPLGEDKN